MFEEYYVYVIGLVLILISGILFSYIKNNQKSEEYKWLVHAAIGFLFFMSGIGTIIVRGIVDVTS